MKNRQRGLKFQVLTFTLITLLISLTLNTLFTIFNHMIMDMNLQELIYAVENNQEYTVILHELDDLGLSVNIIIDSTIIVLMALLIYIFVNRIVKNIERMNKDVMKIEAGNRVHKLQDQEAELGNLANSINKMSESLNDLIDEKDRVYANISHDVKTPLTSLKGYLYILKEGHYQSENEKQDYIERMLLKVDEVDNIVNKVLDLKPNVENSYSSFEVFKNELDSAINELEINGFNVKINVIEFESTAVIAPTLLNRLVNNNVSNIIKYSSDKEVYLSLREDNEHIVLTFKNKADKSTLNNMELLKERFYTQDLSRTYKSNGLGLSICDEIIKSINGEFTITEENGNLLVFNYKFLKE